MIHNFYRSAAIGGEDNVFRQERELLERAGIEVVTYTRSNDDVDENDQVEVLRTAASMSWSGRSHREVAALIRRERPQLAHFHNTFPLITPSAYAACRENGVPVVQTLHNYRIVCSSATFFRDGHVCETCTAGSPWAGVRHRCYRQTTAGSAAVAWMLWNSWRRGTYTDLIDQYVTLTRFAAEQVRGARAAAGPDSRQAEFRGRCRRRRRRWRGLRRVRRPTVGGEGRHDDAAGLDTPARRAAGRGRRWSAARRGRGDGPPARDPGALPRRAAAPRGAGHHRSRGRAGRAVRVLRGVSAGDRRRVRTGNADGRLADRRPDRTRAPRRDRPALRARRSGIDGRCGTQALVGCVVARADSGSPGAASTSSATPRHATWRNCSRSTHW